LKKKGLYENKRELFLINISNSDYEN
jgi:hypothetical protein